MGSDLLHLEVLCSTIAVFCFIMSLALYDYYLVFVIFGYLFLVLQFIAVINLTKRKIKTREVIMKQTNNIYSEKVHKNSKNKK